MNNNPNNLPDSLSDSVTCEKSGVVDQKSSLTLQEIGFLEHYFISPYSSKEEELSKDQAMVAAGYGHFSMPYRNRLANKILRKYESQAGDVREIFCDIGMGQARIARGIKHKAENAVSEVVGLNALKLAAQCTRMVEEPQASHQGVNIIINCGVEPQPGGPGAPARPVSVTIREGLPPGKPMQITK